MVAKVIFEVKTISRLKIFPETAPRSYIFSLEPTSRTVVWPGGVAVETWIDCVSTAALASSIGDETLSTDCRAGRRDGREV